MNRSLLALALVSASLLVGCYPAPPEPSTEDDPPSATPDAAPGGGAPDAPPASNGNPHDATVFKTVVQPMLDSYGCTNDGCHGSGAGQVKLFKNPAGADLDANFTVVTTRNNLKEPEKSRIYFKGLNSHLGSRVFSGGDAQKFLDWVKAAAAKAP